MEDGAGAALAIIATGEETRNKTRPEIERNRVGDHQRLHRIKRNRGRVGRVGRRATGVSL